MAAHDRRQGCTVSRARLLLLSDPESYELLACALLVWSGLSLLQEPTNAVAAPLTLSARMLFGDATRVVGGALLALAAVRVGAVLRSHITTRRACALLAAAWWTFASVQVVSVNGPLDVRVAWCLTLAAWCVWTSWRLGRPGVKVGR